MSIDDMCDTASSWHKGGIGGQPGGMSESEDFHTIFAGMCISLPVSRQFQIQD